jgi:hypothetical protein
VTAAVGHDGARRCESMRRDGDGELPAVFGVPWTIARSPASSLARPSSGRFPPPAGSFGVPAAHAVAKEHSLLLIRTSARQGRADSWPGPAPHHRTGQECMKSDFFMRNPHRTPPRLLGSGPDPPPPAHRGRCRAIELATTRIIRYLFTRLTARLANDLAGSGGEAGPAERPPGVKPPIHPSPIAIAWIPKLDHLGIPAHPDWGPAEAIPLLHRGVPRPRRQPTPIPRTRLNAEAPRAASSRNPRRARHTRPRAPRALRNSQGTPHHPEGRLAGRRRRLSQRNRPRRPGSEGTGCHPACTHRLNQRLG